MSSTPRQSQLGHDARLSSVRLALLADGWYRATRMLPLGLVARNQEYVDGCAMGVPETAHVVGRAQRKRDDITVALLVQ